MNQFVNLEPLKMRLKSWRVRLGLGLILLVLLIVWLGWDYDKVDQQKAYGVSNGASSMDAQPIAEEEKQFFSALKNKSFAKEYIDSYRKEKPSHLSKEEWRQIHASLLGHPNWKTERDRVAGFYKFQKGYDALLAALQNQGNITAQARAQAQALADGLLDGVKSEQISPAEALAMKVLTLRILESNEQVRQERLKQWAQEVKPYLKEPTEDPRDKTYLKRQEEVTAQWSRQYPPDATDVLEKMLNDVRKEVYGN